MLCSTFFEKTGDFKRKTEIFKDFAVAVPFRCAYFRLVWINHRKIIFKKLLLFIYIAHIIAIAFVYSMYGTCTTRRLFANFNEFTGEIYAEWKKRF